MDSYPPSPSVTTRAKNGSVDPTLQIRSFWPETPPKNDRPPKKTHDQMCVCERCRFWAFFGRGLRHLRGIFYLRLLDVKLLRLRDVFWRGGTRLCAFSCSLLYHPEEEDYSSRFPARSCYRSCCLPGSETIPLLSFVFCDGC